MWLSPFFVTCAVYFLLWIPEDPPSWLGALVKCLPVLCLALYLRARGSPSLPRAALLCSAVGDACLIWPQAFFYGEPLGVWREGGGHSGTHSESVVSEN